MRHQMSPMCHVHQYKKHMAGINHALLRFAKDAVGKELGEP